MESHLARPPASPCRLTAGRQLARSQAHRQLTRMTRRSSSMRILGDTWIVKGPPRCWPSGPTSAPYSSSVCCVAMAQFGRAVVSLHGGEWDGWAMQGRWRGGNMWHMLTTSARRSHQLADDAQRDGGPALCLVSRPSWGRVAVGHARRVGRAPVGLCLLRRRVVHGRPLWKRRKAGARVMRWAGWLAVARSHAASDRCKAAAGRRHIPRTRQLPAVGLHHRHILLLLAVKGVVVGGHGLEAGAPRACRQLAESSAAASRSSVGGRRGGAPLPSRAPRAPPAPRLAPGCTWSPHHSRRCPGRRPRAAPPPPPRSTRAWP